MGEAFATFGALWLLKSWAGLPLSFIYVFGAQRLVPTGDSAWYSRVRKPWWHPPFWMFPLMWIPLKSMQSVALWLAIREASNAPGDVGIAVAVFSAHMALGIWWNRVFFGLKRIAQSVVWMLLFWLSICASIGALHRVRPAAGALMAPTIGWVTVATALNVALWRMNAGGVPDLTAEERAAYRKEKEEGGRQKRA